MSSSQHRRTPAEVSEEVQQEQATTIALLQAALDSATEGLFVVGRDGRIIAWNRRFVEMVRIPADALESRSRERVVAWILAQVEQPDALRRRVRWLDEHPEDEGHDLVRFRDGRIVEYHCRAQRLGETVTGRVWSLRDVTLHDRTEAVLRDSEERYRSLYANTPVMMHSIDAEGRLVSVSNAWLEGLGYTREEVIGRRSVEFLTAQSREYARKVVLPEFFVTGVLKDVPYQFVKKSGEVVDVLLSAICERDAAGKVLRSLAVLIDVTRRKRAEAERDRLLGEAEAAWESAERALLLLDILLMTAPVGMGFLDHDLRYVRVNEALAAMHGVEPADDIGRTPWDAVPELAPRLAPLMRRVLETGEALTNVEITGTVPGSTPETRNWLASYYPVRVGGGKVSHVGVVVVDVTEQKRAEETQARLYREAQEAVRVRDDFLAIASHELRTPLTPLAMRLQILERKLRQGEPVDASVVEKALRHLDRLTNLISDLLDVSRIQAGRLQLHREPVSLTAVVEQLVLEHNLGHRTHQATIDADGAELVVTADRARLAQVVTNLLDNAAKYSPPDSPIHVRLVRQDGEAILSVSDRGIGIPKEQQPMLFERFFRAENAPITGYGGLGLGLYITRDIVERHGGRIWVESEVGRGSTFHVALPLEQS
jgi:PAS domain S-box-containing protein